MNGNSGAAQVARIPKGSTIRVGTNRKPENLYVNLYRKTA